MNRISVIENQNREYEKKWKGCVTDNFRIHNSKICGIMWAGSEAGAQLIGPNVSF